MMTVKAQSGKVKYMRWAARSFGIISGISGLLYSEADILGQQRFIFGLADWRCLFPVLLPIILVALAWKWSGKWPELLSGILFTLWGLTFFLPALISALAFEPTGIVIGQQFPAALAMVLQYLPLITGILFILTYRITRSVKS
jgi:hypothetical protein